MSGTATRRTNAPGSVPGRIRMRLRLHRRNDLRETSRGRRRLRTIGHALMVAGVVGDDLSAARGSPEYDRVSRKRPEGPMPIATPDAYNEMLDRAKQGAFAYPAVNVTSSQTLNSAIRGFAEARSDGIVQVSTGGAQYLSGSTINDMVTGAVALAAFAHEVAQKYDVTIALHTDHCPK